MSSTFMQCAIDGYVVIGIFRPEIHVRYLEAGVFSRSDCFLTYVQPGADFVNRFLDHKMTKKAPAHLSRNRYFPIFSLFNREVGSLLGDRINEADSGDEI